MKNNNIPRKADLEAISSGIHEARKNTQLETPAAADLEAIPETSPPADMEHLEEMKRWLEKHTRRGWAEDASIHAAWQEKQEREKHLHYDPWTASEDRARLESIRYCGGRYGKPWFQWCAAGRIESRKKEIIEAVSKKPGDRAESFLLFAALDDLMENGLVAPQWLAVYFRSCFQDIDRGDAGNCLNTAFGKPFPTGKGVKGRHRKKQYEDEEAKHKIFQYVAEAVAGGKSISKEFWTEVATACLQSVKVGVKGVKVGGKGRRADAERLYNECCKNLRRNPIKERTEKRRGERKSNQSAK